LFDARASGDDRCALGDLLPCAGKVDERLRQNQKGVVSRSLDAWIVGIQLARDSASLE
jgi:hypothetical protein